MYYEYMYNITCASAKEMRFSVNKDMSLDP